MSDPVSFQEIEAAADRISGAVLRTPCPASVPLSEASRMKVFCKMENLQRTGSFKERGARNALVVLGDAQKKRGVIAASAGNHALGLAYHGQLLGIPVTVVMPRSAPLTKVSNCQKFGATVLLQGSTFAEARSLADAVGSEQGLHYVNGYDDPPVIAGQGTIALEIFEQVPDLDAVVVPIGGGGLIAGIALAIKTLKPSVAVIGVEPVRAASFTAALRAGRPVPTPPQPTLADGLAVAQAGDTAFAVARNLVDEVVLVEEQHIALSVLRLLELEKSLVEGAGAAGIAACLAGLLPELEERTVVLPLCGGNIDTSTLGRVLERGLAHDGRLCRLSATISDRPGGLATFARIVAEEGGSIMEVDHDRAFASEDLTTVVVHCVMETRDSAHLQTIRDRLAREGFSSPADASH